MSTTNFKSEISTIYSIGINNGYDKTIFEKIFKKINRKLITSNFFILLNQKPTKHTKKLPFISDRITNPIARIFRKNSITPALYNKNTLTSKLVNNKLGKIEKMSRSVRL